MSENPPLTTPAVPAPTPAKSSGRGFIEDLIVSGFGMATSAAVAYGSHYSAVHWDFAPFTWMADMILPVGAIGCGFVAAIGYLIGARLFNHRPTRWLMLNIVFVALTTYFSIHYLNYSEAKVRSRGGLEVPIAHLMSFEQYMKEVTEHMTYKDSHSTGEGTQLGMWGWGVAGLQVLGFSLGGFLIYGMLKAVPYCDRCSKYLSQKKQRVAKWKAADAMQQAYAEVANLIQGGHLQEAIDHHARLGEDRRFSIGATLNLELRKCPTCENRTLRLFGQRRRGRNWATVGQLLTPTEQPLQMV